MSPLTRSTDQDLSGIKKRSTRPQQQFFTIGDVAKEFGVSLRTLRFYEDRGLLKPFRDGSSRFYDEKQKARLVLILKGKQLGFTLGEIRDLIESKGGGVSSATLSLKPDQIALQITHLERQRNEIDGAIEELRATYRGLVEGQ